VRAAEELGSSTSSSALLPSAHGNPPKGGQRSGGQRTLPLLHPTVDPVEWSDECARVAPSLNVKLHWQQLHWRHRLVLAQQHSPLWAEHAPAIATPLEELVRARAAGLDLLSPLRAEHEREQKEYEKQQQKAAEAQQRVDACSIELAETVEAIERAKQTAAGRGEELSGNEPLTRIRGALKLLRAEVRSLTLKEAMLQQTLGGRRARLARSRELGGAEGADGLGGSPPESRPGSGPRTGVDSGVGSRTGSRAAAGSAATLDDAAESELGPRRNV